MYMLCSKCGKREVEILVKQVINKEVHDIGLCRECAEQLGFLSRQMPSITISFAVCDPEPLKIKHKRSSARQKKEEQENALVCSECETVYAKFKETGLLGCPHCYESFRFPLGAYLQEHQGAESHWSGTSDMFTHIALSDAQAPLSFAVSAKDTVEDERSRLKKDIESAVSCEDYERAAYLRDKLNSLEERNSDDDR